MPANDTYARFYIHPTLIGDPNPTERKKPTFKDVVMAEIFIKGSKNTSFSKRVYDDDEDLLRNDSGETLPELYPKAWAAFKNEDDEAYGTPLRALHGIGPSQVMNLNALGIESVEDLAGLDDAVVLGQQGMVELRKRAQAFLDAMEPEKLEAEKAAQEAEKAELRQEMEAMRQQLAELQAAPKRTRRKRNAEGQLE